MTIAYSITLALAVGLLIAYLFLVKTKEFWMTMLYICISVVNLGYLLLSIAYTVEFAVLANDIAYLGSVFLSLCMFFTIVKLCGFETKRRYVIGCIISAVLMFLIVASSPMLPLYYKSVEIEVVSGSVKLVKEYGPLHNLYLVYLLVYFAAMIATIVYSVEQQKPGATKFAGFMAGVVCSNILVWLFEKFISWDFEFLYVSYIISELLLLLVYWMMQDYVHKADIQKYAKPEQEQMGVEITAMPMAVKISKILGCVGEGDALSIREREILELILANRKRKEIAEQMHLSENTVKTYTRTLYAKLGVTCREELYALLLETNT
jgi:DNA-binding CsgD family transcriptional regulator